MADSDYEGDNAEGFVPLGDGSHLNSEENSKKVSYNKVSAEDVKAQLERRRAVERQKRQERAASRSPIFSVARVAITVVCLIGSVGSLMYLSGTSGKYDAELKSNLAKINDLENKGHDLDSQEKVTIKPAVITNNITTARERGQKITDIQNAMADTRPMDDMLDDELDRQVEAYSQQVDEIKSLMTKEATTTGDFAPQQRWVSPSELRTDPDDKSVREPYSFPSDQYTWTMHELQSFNSSTNSVPVIWTSVFTGGKYKGQMIAWVKAEFDPEAGLFSTFESGTTPLGARLVGATLNGDTSEFNEEQKAKSQAELRLDALRAMQNGQDTELSEEKKNGISQLEGKEREEAAKDADGASDTEAGDDDSADDESSTKSGDEDNADDAAKDSDN